MQTDRAAWKTAGDHLQDNPSRHRKGLIHKGWAHATDAIARHLQVVLSCCAIVIFANARWSVSTSKRACEPMYCPQGGEGPCARACVCDDDRRLEAVYRQEAPKLLSFLKRRIWPEDDRHDLVQEAFTRLVAARSAAVSSNPGAYLHGIVRHLLADRVRAWAKAQSFDPVVYSAGNDIATPDVAAEINDMRERYRRAVESLPPRTKEVYLLHRADELGYRQIAEQLDISIRTVEWHVAEAIVRIGKSIGHAHG
ncbi:MAG: sigma-70 family RNA polymerase sigma factor [Sphingobium sp.]|uniref:RNA polymerase sigma factor n=1 Tax=Sphingobium sp. TaxID=1912891 RepID=UPI003BAF637B